jgi:hypothetical protein
VNRTGDLFSMAHKRRKPLPAEADRGIAAIGGLAGMALKQEDEMSEELEGKALDNAVTQANAEATGLPASWAPYSTSWEYGGPIIEREDIELTRRETMPSLWEWVGTTMHGFEATGPTPLIAAMRAFVASRKA